MTERLLTKAETDRLVAAGIVPPWMPQQLLSLLDEIATLKDVNDSLHKKLLRWEWIAERDHGKPISTGYIDELEERVAALNKELIDFANFAEDSGWFNLADEIRRRAEEANDRKQRQDLTEGTQRSRSSG